MDKIEELKKLKSRYALGEITRKDYETKKKNIIENEQSVITDLELSQIEKLVDLKKVTDAGDNIKSSVEFQAWSIISYVVGFIFIITGLIDSLGQLDFASGHFMMAYFLFIVSFIFWISSMVKLSGAGSKLKKIIRKKT